ncbi:VRR-NUC domain-containing protein [Siphonobacter sp.]|uniref:VRR-NUC domain-containing protein n=1 Tax=Siphonobacter sp. TaxID=1869184 RepID=UPI003B3A8F6E
MSERLELPPKYYLEYFRYLIEFVRRFYLELLTDDEREFLHDFDHLSEDAQCLFIRFTNRRVAFFRVRKLNYPEIEYWGEALLELERKGFVAPLSVYHQNRAGEVLDIFNKTEVLSFAKQLTLDTKGKASLKKEELSDWLLESAPFDDLSVLIGASEPVVKVNYEAQTMLFKFLFFGNRHADMSEFVVRDLGHLRFERFDEDRFVPHFTTRQEVEDRLKVSLAAEDFQLMKAAETDPLAINIWFLDWYENHTPLAEIAQPSLDRLILKLAGYMERQKKLEEALVLFRLTNVPPSRERQVRLLLKLKDTEAATALVEEIMVNPYNAEEQFFAIDFQNQQAAQGQKKRARKSTTEWLLKSESVTIDLTWRYRVEEGVAEHFRQQGKHAVHTENFLFDGLFGLLFWDIIFDAGSSAIHHPLQRSPSDIYKPTFFEKRRPALMERLELIENTADTLTFLEGMFEEKYGIVNPLVVWFPELLNLIRAAIEKIPTHLLQRLLIEMATNVREHTRGFPDLFVWDENGYDFIEVKSPTDHLSPQQLYWLRFFETIGLRSKVLRVVWGSVA